MGNTENYCWENHVFWMRTMNVLKNAEGRKREKREEP